MYDAIISFLLNCAPQRVYVFIMSSTRFRVNPHYSWLNVKEFLTRSRHKIWTLSDCNWTRTHNHLLRKRTLNHLAKLAILEIWLSIRLWTKWLWVWVQLQCSSTRLIYLVRFSSPWKQQKTSAFLICLVGGGDKERDLASNGLIRDS